MKNNDLDFPYYACCGSPTGYSHSATCWVNKLKKTNRRLAFIFKAFAVLSLITFVYVLFSH